MRAKRLSTISAPLLHLFCVLRFRLRHMQRTHKAKHNRKQMAIKQTYQ
jgi:hypothetical protein